MNQRESTMKILSSRIFLAGLLVLGLIATLLMQPASHFRKRNDQRHNPRTYLCLRLQAFGLEHISLWVAGVSFKCTLIHQAICSAVLPRMMDCTLLRLAANTVIMRSMLSLRLHPAFLLSRVIQS